MPPGFAEQSYLTDTWPGASGWTGSPQTVTTCGSYGSIVGGWNVWGSGTYLQKTISNLPTHTQLRVQFEYYAIETWDGERAQLRVDNTLVWDQAYTGYEDTSNNLADMVRSDQ